MISNFLNLLKLRLLVELVCAQDDKLLEVLTLQLQRTLWNGQLMKMIKILFMYWV